MPNTFTKIASVTVGSGGASSIDFTSIPSTYTDLCLKFSTRTTDTGAAFTAVGFTINGNESNGSWRLLYGNNGGAFSGSNSGYSDTAYSSSATTTSNTFANSEIYLPNYAGSNYKSFSVDFVTENNSSASNANIYGFRANLWSSTAAVTSVSLLSRAGNFVQYSTAVLYGIKNS